MCRPFISEPGLVNRWRAGDRRPAVCVSCNNCVEEAKSGRGISCVPPVARGAQTFFPQTTRQLPASPPFPPGTHYEVSIGLEQWRGGFLPVVKVLTRQGDTPIDDGLSVPLGSQDHRKIFQAVEEMLAEYNQHA
jgi:hypothetical protein